MSTSLRSSGGAPLLAFGSALLLAGLFGCQQIQVASPLPGYEVGWQEDRIQVSWQANGGARCDLQVRLFDAADQSVGEAALDGSRSGQWASAALPVGAYRVEIEAQTQTRPKETTREKFTVRLARRPRYELISRDQLGLPAPEPLRALYVVHPDLVAAGSNAWPFTKVTQEKFRSRLADVVLTVMDAAFERADRLYPKADAEEPWEEFERIRKVLLQEGRVARTLDPQILVVIDYRAARRSAGTSPQLLFRVLDLSCLEYDYAEDPGPVRMLSKRSLIFEDYVELTEPQGDEDLIVQLVSGFRAVLGDMRASRRYLRYVTLVKENARVSKEGPASDLVGLFSEKYFAAPDTALPAFHDYVEERLLFDDTTATASVVDVTLGADVNGKELN